ncbi:MAG: GTPase Era [Crocinitomicaceae bacterium]|nr:GTPase Era [Crocinitomicaceae bacterium]|tara:strand:+ start:10111 stop:10986 length:876 start_codon:yes stop_codon:yes gene_type:complete
MSHKSGFVNIIGSPNVGKSTLMNQLVGERLSIITSKQQTTRHRIMGMVNEENYQIVFSDTPGIIDPAYKLHENMMKFVSEALKDADVLIVMTDVYEEIDKIKERVLRFSKLEIPVLVFINKIDQSNQEKLILLVESWKKMLPKAEILPISALHNMGIDFILPKIVELLPEGPAYFDKDQLTNKNMRFFVSEIIREKILLQYQKEVPYSCEVVVEEYKEDDDIIRIRTNIMVSRDTQRAILIGNKGDKIKKLGITSREDIEAFVLKKVHLELYVKVDKDWRNKDGKLKKYGY